MINTNEGQENLGIPETLMKNKIIHRFIESRANTPKYFKAQEPSCFGSYCLLVEDALCTIGLYKNHCGYSFFEERRAFPSEPRYVFSESSTYWSESTISSLIGRFTIPASELIVQMERTQKPILCVDRSVVMFACRLVCVQTQAVLSENFREDFQNEDRKLIRAENHFIGPRAFVRKENRIMKLFIGRNIKKNVSAIAFASSEEKAREMIERSITKGNVKRKYFPLSFYEQEVNEELFELLKLKNFTYFGTEFH